MTPTKQWSPVLIRRQRKYEAEQAIEELIKRGYVVISPLQEIQKHGKVFDRDDYNRKIFKGNTSSSCWIAKLRKVVE